MANLPRWVIWRKAYEINLTFEWNNENLWESKTDDGLRIAAFPESSSIESKEPFEEMPYWNSLLLSHPSSSCSLCYMAKWPTTPSFQHCAFHIICTTNMAISMPNAIIKLRQAPALLQFRKVKMVYFLYIAEVLQGKKVMYMVLSGNGSLNVSISEGWLVHVDLCYKIRHYQFLDCFCYKKQGVFKYLWRFLVIQSLFSDRE